MNQIIVVDDSLVNQLALKKILEHEYEVLCANSGKQLFQILEESDPKLILLDVVMPELDGFQVIEKLKSSEQYNKIPVIFITGLNDTESEEKGFKLGAIDYIAKPFNERIVNARVQSYVQLYDFIRQTERMGQYDGLTGLYNKKMTEMQIKKQLSSRPSLKNGALMIIDVDNFKSINDTFGHLYGDAVITQLGSGLRSIFQKSDILGRVGGDEFFVFLRNYNERSVLEVKAQDVCNEFSKTFEQNNEIVKISASIGIATTDNSFDFEEIYTFADVALYNTKAKGKNGFTFYTGEEQGKYKSERTDIENDKQKHNDASENIREFKDNLKEYVFNLVEGTKVAEYTIQSILQMISSQFGFKGGFITKLDYEETGVKRINEWISSAKESHANTERVSIENVLNLYDKFDQNNLAVLKSGEPIFDDTAHSENGLYLFALKNKKALLGFIAFENATSQKELNPRAQSNFIDVCQQLSTVVVNQFLIESTMNEKQNMITVLNNIDEPVYVVNPDSKNHLFANDAAKKSDEKMHTGLCLSAKSTCVSCPLKAAVSNGGYYENKEYLCKEIVWQNGSKAYFIRYKEV